MKKVFITLIALLLTLAASAAVQYNGLWYNLNSSDNTAEVVASQGTKYSGDISIPSYVNYDNKIYNVTSIGLSAFEGCTGLTSIYIPSGVKTLEQGAFYECSSLTYVKIPEGVTKIGLGAFSKCSKLTSVIIPSTVTTIDKYAFDYCTSLSHIVSGIQQPNTIENNVFDTHSSSYSVYSQATLVVPDGSKSAYKSKSVWKTFTNIKEASEQKSRSIHVAKAGTLSHYISDMEKYKIEELTLSGNLNGTDFRLIRDMAGINFELISLGNYSTITTSGILKVLDIANAKIVAGGGYYYAWTKKSWEIEYEYGTRDNSISDYMFYGCKLQSIKNPNSVTSIGEYAFVCKGLTSVNIPSSVTSIGENAFNGQSGLTSITIPNSVTSIGSSAFIGCSSLSTIVSEIENPFVISKSVFDSDIYQTAELLIPEGTLAAYQSTSSWNLFFKLGGAIGDEFNYEGINYRIGENNTVSVIQEHYSGDLVIPSQVPYYGVKYTVTSIASMAFANYCNELTSITIPSTITNIEDGAFFEYLDNLSAVHITDLKAWCNIHYSDGCYPAETCPLWWAKHLYLNGEEVKDMVIPDGVTEINKYSFAYCSGLTSVTISKGVTSIGSNAFSGCEDLVRIVSRNKIPPTCGSNAFSSKAYCTVWVPKGCGEAYLKANEWKDFKEIREIDGDINLDGKVNKADIDALATYIVHGTPAIYGTIADLNDDEKVNAADVVMLVNLLNSGDLSTEFQPYFGSDNGNLVVTSITCTLKNERKEAIQLTKCELYYNNSLVSYKSYSGGSTVAAGGSRDCSFTGLSKPANSSSFTVIWHYTFNGEDFVYRCDITE